MREALFAALAAKEKEYISFWEDVCNIESPTKDKARVDAACDYVVRRAEGYGWQVEIDPQPVSGNTVCITMNPDAPGAPVCLSGHMDTVHPVGAFGTPAVTRDETKIYGPGVCDCKGGVVAGFYAMAALAEIGFTARPVKLILQTDEEVSSMTSHKSTVEFMCKKGEGCAAFLNLEGAKAGHATIERKGIVGFTLEITGRSAHSARCTRGASAVTEAAHKIIALEQYKDDKGLTFNCSLLEGGETRNTVPGHCSFSVDIRFVDEAQLEQAREIVKEIAEHTTVEGTSCKVIPLNYRHAMPRREQNVRLLQQMNEIWQQNGLSSLAEGASVGGSDAADVTVYGLPCVDSLGVLGGKIHTGEEYALLSSLKEFATRLALIAMYL